ncbi:MAG: Acetylglutamate kinase [Firmicutes bacterium ADurb.Bin193]|nr:MAG: Acetylglutamate kinase [Firmicutes bacterium ADurb.Bin193]
MQKYINKANILIEALPYIQKLSGKTVVIKYGGNAMISEELKQKVMEDITLLKYVGVNPVVVHGGGPDITEALSLYNIKSEFVNGLRVTDDKTIHVAQMVLAGKTNKEIVASLNVRGGNAIGLCGIDGKLIECEKFMPKVDGKPVDIGYVGKITNINAHALSMLANDRYIPVVAPIGIGKDGESYNINADTVAGAIAAALKAEKLMLLTDVKGIKKSEDSDEIIYEISQKEIFKMIDEGKINGGMIPKTLSCIDAIDAGVKRVHIIDGRIPHCILLEIFTDTGIGTMITA